MILKHGVLIIGEIDEQGDIADITLELLRIGRRIADILNIRLIAALFGNDVGRAAIEVALYGADAVYKRESPLLADFKADIWVEAGTIEEPKLVLLKYA